MEIKMPYVKEFLNNLEIYKDASSNTIVNYTIDLKLFFTFTQGKYASGKVVNNVNTIKKYTEYLLKEKKDSRSTINRRLSSLKSYYNYLYDEKIINFNMSSHIRYLKQDEAKVKEVILQEDIYKKLDTITHVRDRALLETIFSTGIREEEASNLNIENVNFENKLLTVIKGKGNKTRVIPIGDEAVKWIKAYIGSRKSGSLFLNNRAERLGTKSIYNICKKHFDIPPHDLRHAFATHLILKTGNLKAVSEMLGHSSTRTTETVYTHLKSHHLTQIYDSGGMR